MVFFVSGGNELEVPVKILALIWVKLIKKLISISVNFFIFKFEQSLKTLSRELTLNYFYHNSSFLW